MQNILFFLEVTKNDMLKLAYLKALYEMIYNQHSLPFLSIKKLCTKNLNLTIRFGNNL